MGTNDYHDEEQLNRQIDAMLSSEEELKTALEGDNPLLYIGAYLANEALPVPSEAAKTRMLEQVQSAQILSPNFMSWGLSVVAIVVVILGGVWFASSNSPEDITNSDSILTEDNSQLTEESSSELFVTEEASSEAIEAEETNDLLSVETEPPIINSENVEPELSPDVESTEGQISETNLSDVLLVNPGGPVNVRSGPGTSFDIIATVTPNTEVRRIGVSAAGDWVEVTLPDGVRGWIANVLLSEIQGSDGQPIAPGSGGRDDEDDCNGRGNSCNAPRHTGENQGRGNSEND